MKGIDEDQRRVRALLDGFLAAMVSLAEHIVPVGGDLVLQHRTRLRVLGRELAGEPTAERLTQTVGALNEELASFAAKATELLEGREQDVRAIIATVAEISQTIAVHQGTQTAKLAQLGDELAHISTMDDLGAMRELLVRQAGEAKSLAASYAANHIALEQLHREVAAYRERLARVEALAFTDKLTGLFNRTEGERRLSDAMHTGEPFCVLLFDINRFKRINDQYGHLAGDRVLQRFAQRLALSVRPTDIVCRWGGDEFLVILGGCRLAQGINRAKALARSCSLTEPLSRNGVTVQEPIEAAVGTVEYRSGESSTELFQRVDTLLYRAKNNPAQDEQIGQYSA